MDFLNQWRRKAQAEKSAALTTRQRGQQAEEKALQHLLSAGLRLIERNYRTPGRGGGEIDLIMREPDGTLVFVEVRSRVNNTFGGAAASIGGTKQKHLIFAAQTYLLQFNTLPACRFDAVLVEPQLQWIRGAFDAN